MHGSDGLALDDWRVTLGIRLPGIRIHQAGCAEGHMKVRW